MGDTTRYAEEVFLTLFGGMLTVFIVELEPTENLLASLIGLSIPIAIFFLLLVFTTSFFGSLWKDKGFKESFKYYSPLLFSIGVGGIALRLLLLLRAVNPLSSPEKYFSIVLLAFLLISIGVFLPPKIKNKLFNKTS